MLIIPAFNNDLSFSVSPLQGCSCSLPLMRDIHHLCQDSPRTACSAGWTRLVTAWGWDPSHPRDGCPCLYPPVKEAVSIRGVDAVDLRKHLWDTRGSPGLGTAVRKHNSQHCSLVGFICSQHQWLLSYSICPSTGDNPNIVNKMIVFTRILAYCFVQLSRTCGGCFGLGGGVSWLWEPACRRLSDKWDDGMGCTAHGEGQWGGWQCGMRGWLTAHPGEDGYEEGLPGTAAAQRSSPAAWYRMVAEWGAARRSHGTPHQALHPGLDLPWGLRQGHVVVRVDTGGVPCIFMLCIKLGETRSPVGPLGVAAPL